VIPNRISLCRLVERSLERAHTCGIHVSFGPSARSGELLGKGGCGHDRRTPRRYKRAEQPRRFDHSALGVPPSRLDRVEPGTFDRQETPDQSDATAAGFDPAVVVPYPDPHRLTAMPRGVVPNEQQPRASQRPLLRIVARDRLFDQPQRLIRLRPSMPGGERLRRSQCGGEGSMFSVREWTRKDRCSHSTQENAFPITSSDAVLGTPGRERSEPQTLAAHDRLGAARLPRSGINLARTTGVAPAIFHDAGRRHGYLVHRWAVQRSVSCRDGLFHRVRTFLRHLRDRPRMTCDLRRSLAGFLQHYLARPGA